MCRYSVSGAASGRMSAASSPISSAISSSGTRVADQRLVDVEVEEADLGVGDPPHRLHVDADQLQEGDEREAGGEDAGAVAQRVDVVGAEQPLAAERGAEDDEDALDQLRLEAGLRGDLLDRDLLLGAAGRAPRRSRRRAGPRGRPRFSSSSEWPRSRIRATTRAWAAAAAVQRPRRTGTIFSAAQRFSVLGGDARAAERLAEGDALVRRHLVRQHSFAV